MPTQRQIRRMAKDRGIDAEEMSKRVFGRMRKLGWRPLSQGGPTKRWRNRA